MPSYQSYLNAYNRRLGSISNRFNNPYSYSLGSPSEDIVNTMIEGMLYNPQPIASEIIQDDSRSFLDRSLDALMLPIYTVAGGVDGLIRDDKGVLEGMWQGVKAGNPFGDGFEEGETTFSDVLGSMGWNPDSTLGKVAKGVTGFALDVVLDPTTYLTGGTSAIIKGTGRVGRANQTLAKATEDVARAQADNIVRDLTEKGINPDLAKRFAEKKANDTLNTTVLGMTDEMAEEIIKNQIYKRNDYLAKEGAPLISKSADAIKRDAAKLADEFNRVIGIRDARGAGEITWGIGNLPFMPKKWQDKVIRLGSAQNLRLASDAIGISRAYARLRNSIYGSQIGRLFSTKSPLFKMANENPGKLWEMLEFVEHTRGLKLDKLQEERAITDYFKSLNLTPDENREILQLLQDKTIWHKVAEKVRVADLDKVRNARKIMDSRVAKAQEELDTILQKKEIAEMWRSALDDEIVSERAFYDAMMNEFREDLERINITRIQGEREIQKTIDTILDELSKFETPQNEQEALRKLHELVKRENERMDKHMKKDLDTPDTSDLNVTGASKEATNLDSVIKRGDSAPGREVQYALGEALSNYVFGNSNYFKRISKHGLDDLMEKVNQGWSKARIKEYVEKNPQRFDPHFRDINSLIAKQLGYKNWFEDGFKYPLAKLLGKTPEQVKDNTIDDLVRELTSLREAGRLSKQKEKQFLRLLHKEYQRKRLRLKYSQMSVEEFKAHQRAIADEELMKDFYTTEDEWLDFRRNEFADDDYANPARRQNATGRNPYEVAGDTPRDEIIPDLVEHGAFTEEALERMEVDGFFRQYVNRMADEVNTIAVRDFNKTFSDMTDKQKQYVIGLAKGVVEKNFKPKLPEVKQKATQEAVKRIKEDAREFREEIQTVRSATPQEIYERTIMGQADVGEKELLFKQLEDARNELQKFVGETKELEQRSRDFYNQRIQEQKEYITKLEGKKQEFQRWIDEADDATIETLEKEINTLEDALKDNDALEMYVAGKTDEFFQLMNDKDRYTRNVSLRKSFADGSLSMQTRNGQIFVKENATIDEVIDFLKHGKRGAGAKPLLGDLEKLGFGEGKIRAILNNPEKLRNFLVEFELRKNEYNGDVLSATHKALSMFEPYDLKRMVDESSPVDAGVLVLDKTASSKKVANIVKTLRDKFQQIGKDEVAIGKLSEEQFEALMWDYVPHILTEDGRDFFRSMNELVEHGSKVSHDLGYGVSFNPHAKSRTIQGKTIEEINEHFRDKLKGKNLFSENVADIYLARAMKHTELMYDDRYMRTMMNVFGKEVPHNGVVEKGYKAVMNYGMLRETTKYMASMRLSMHISDEVGRYLQANGDAIRHMARQSGVSEDKLIQEHLDKFIADNFSDEQVKSLWEGFHKESLKGSKLGSRVLDDEALPMAEMNPDQITNLRNMWDSISNEYRTNLHKRFMRDVMMEGSKDSVLGGMLQQLSDVQRRLASMRGSQSGVTSDLINEQSRLVSDIFEYAKQNRDLLGERSNNVLRMMDELDEFGQPQIRQVNEAIVNKANQARKLQRAKDQSRLLKMYDKFLHFMKLNQTVVAPSFHMRNKFSNMFLGWLGTGRDAVNKDFQITAMKLAHLNGDISAIRELTEKSKYWNDKFRPIQIDNPHPSLVESVGLNNGQLHWTDLYDLAVRHNVIDQGQFARDIGAGSASRGLFKGLKYTKKDGARISLDPTDTANFIAYQKGTKVGTTFENSDRMIIFLSQLKQGKSVDEASRTAERFLFDYGDLTAFEQNVMKRIFPYYTWLRKNARLQVSQLIENPEKYRTVAKVLNGVEHMTPADERMNSAFISPWAEGWIQLPFSYTNEYGQEEPVILNPNMPFMDLNRIFDPTQVDASFRELFSQMSPQIRNPIELGTNYSAFFNSEIAGERDNKLGAYAEYIGNQFAWGNIANGFNKDNPTDVFLHGLNSTTGVKMNTYDYERSKYMMLDKLRDGNENPIDNAIERALRRLMGE